MDSAFRGIGREISRNYADNLGILNAESYSDHVRFDGRPRTEGPATLAFGMIPHQQGDDDGRENDERENGERGDGHGDGIERGGRRRKRARIERVSDDDEEKKKARGRPRVDTKDETAADVSFDFFDG